MATRAGLAVAGEAPGLGRQPGVVAPGWGWHRSGSRGPGGAAGPGEDTGRVPALLRCQPCRDGALRPGLRPPAVAQGYCDIHSLPKPV